MSPKAVTIEVRPSPDYRIEPPKQRRQRLVRRAPTCEPFDPVAKPLRLLFRDLQRSMETPLATPFETDAMTEKVESLPHGSDPSFLSREL